SSIPSTSRWLFGSASSRRLGLPQPTEEGLHGTRTCCHLRWSHQGADGRGGPAGARRGGAGGITFQRSERASCPRRGDVARDGHLQLRGRLPEGRRDPELDAGRRHARTAHLGDEVQRRHTHVELTAVSLTQYYTATSLDGFIADPDNSLEWLFT